MPKNNALEPIVIKRKIKAKHPAHGGAWKVAYADFVTAMMAFFLLLWLLNVVTESNGQGITDYFEPDTSEEENQAGSGLALAGLTQMVDGALKSAGSPPQVTVPLTTTGSKAGGDKSKKDIKSEDALAEAEAKRVHSEFEGFSKVEAEIRQALQEVRELNEMQDSVMIDHTLDGLRVQILDHEKIPLFLSGKAILNDHGRKMLAIVANVITQLPNHVAITGHTDSSKTVTNKYGNWELSGDRANTARRIMVEFGLGAEKIAKVAGKADKEHLYPDKPYSPLNRRISILLQKQKSLLAEDNQKASISSSKKQG